MISLLAGVVFRSYDRISLLSVLLSILRSDPMVLDGLQGRYRLAAKTAKSLPDS